MLQQPDVIQFIEENLKTIFAYALSRVSNKEDAEDLTNDIVVAMLQSADKLQNQEAFYGYVWGIAANTYRKFLYKRNRRKQEVSAEEMQEDGNESGFDKLPAEGDFAEELADKMALKEDVAKLHREIALLSKEHRECTVAYYFEELTCAEVAKRLGISLEMVKYYLFKTRKILKEGISMEREFGEKSFKPEPFEFVTIFADNFNREYHNMFNRKLPGQILLSAYYTPMSVRELAIELGVASVYLEDELSLLEKYHLIVKNSHGKYQTNLVIYTDDYTKEFQREARKFAVPAMKSILQALKEKVTDIRSINKCCAVLSEERLLWGLLWPIILLGNQHFSEKYPELSKKEEIYQGAAGTNYGTVENEYEGKYGCYTFAGYSGIDENYYAVAADFGVLPEKNRYFTGQDREVFRKKIYETVAGTLEPEFLIFTEKEEDTLCRILDSLSDQMTELYEKMYACACDILKQHAPEQVAAVTERIVFQTLLFRCVGLFGGFAVESGELTVPEVEGPLAFYVRENTKAVMKTCGHNTAAMKSAEKRE
ncbi:MAG: RNA polymerase sigma factor [Lachnospiraceae bacterium]|nr:RNA polymerase sigma factor [Lachnospiraceae bacterium]